MMNIPYNNYKTQSCKNFEKEGKCKFADKCSYAHGTTDLRHPYESYMASNGSASGATGGQAQLAAKPTLNSTSILPANNN